MDMLPTEASVRKEYPIVTGVLDYFPLALAEVARVSYVGQQQHNTPTWDKGKSTDHADCIGRHMLERGADDLALDSDGTLHAAKVIWRALALLQIALERQQAQRLSKQ